MLGKQRRTKRPRPALRPGQNLECLERRELLTGNDPFSYYHTSFQTVNIGPGSPVASNNLTKPVNTATHAQLDMTDNEGKTVSGQDRQGNKWIIKVQGPGAVIVTDATPNDGALDDDIQTIQLIGTDINKTKVYGQATASNRVLTDGTVKFQKLIALNGVNTIQLNGFSLTQVVTPTAANAQQYSDTYVYLPGGVRNLSFHDINGDFDVSEGATPVINVTIGNPSTPLKYPTSIHIDSIFNTATQGTNANPLGVPQTRPTVNIEVNGDIQDLSMLSATNRAYNFTAGRQIQNTPVSTTGRTQVRAMSIKNLKVVGSARNTTFSRGAVTNQPSFGGLKALGTAKFGGTADGVLIAVDGKAHRVVFNRGLGIPAGVPQPGTVTNNQIAGTSLGTPVNEYGYPAYGLEGGVVYADAITNVAAGPANIIQLTPTDPSYMQLQRTNSTYYISRPGTALTGAVIASGDSFQHISIIGNTIGSEIKAGFYYQTFLQGLEGTRARSRIASLRQTGDMVDSVISATYRPADNIYGNGNDQAGNGSITGHQYGDNYTNGRATPLQNLGTGNFAKNKVGYLPPMARSRHVGGRLLRK